jgi:hypothetical protein
LTAGPSEAQDTPAGVRTGPATIPRHWSKYDYPETVPEGAAYHIIEKGDTLWDLSRKYLNNPFLWPQIWDHNKYITDAHWIYPGDPLILPSVAVVAEKAGGAEAAVERTETEARAPSAVALEETGPVLYPATEIVTLQCAPFLVPSREDESLRIIGSEDAKLALADRDIVYLNRGSNAGVRAGDVYTIHHAAYKVKHPMNGRTLGTKVETQGWLRVILTQETSATAVVEQACLDIHPGDYLKPFERATVPMLVRREPPDRLTPPSGKAQGYVVDIAEDAMAAGAGQLVTIDLGSVDGVAPGNMLVVYRIVYPSVPTSRNVLGELAVLSVRENTATAKVMYSTQAILNGDQVEVR